jgi:two-component sensor histidine kinase
MRPLPETELMTELEALRAQARGLQSRQEGLRALLECQQALGVSLELDQVLRTIVRQASLLSGAVGARLFLLDDASPTLRCCDGDGLPPEELRRLEFLIGECLSERVGAADEPPPMVEAGIDSAPDPPPLTLELGQVAYLGLLVTLRDRLLGLLAFPVPASRSYTAEEIDLFSAFVRQAAVALQNARRHSSAVQELVERQRAEAKVQSALAEKDVLLREVHHRVKNNLQVVASLLDLQAGTLRDTTARQALRESKDRVQSMARIHEYLYKCSDVTRIGMETYLRNLTSALREVFSTAPIRLSVRVAGVRLDMDRAIACGLIVNELVSNAFKHAFPANQAGEVGVTLEAQEGEYVLSVQDTGVGLPAGMDPQATSSLGLRLVQLLTRQLGGTLTLGSHPGAMARIAFPARPHDRDAA